MFRHGYWLVPVVGLIVMETLLDGGAEASVAANGELAPVEADTWSKLMAHFVHDGSSYEKNLNGGSAVGKRKRKVGKQKKEKRAFPDDRQVVISGTEKCSQMNGSEAVNVTDYTLEQLMKYFVHDRKDREKINFNELKEYFRKKLNKYLDKVSQGGSEHSKNMFQRIHHNLGGKGDRRIKNKLFGKNDNEMHSEEYEDDDEDDEQMNSGQVSEEKLPKRPMLFDQDCSDDEKISKMFGRPSKPDLPVFFKHVAKIDNEPVVKKVPRSKDHDQDDGTMKFIIIEREKERECCKPHIWEYLYTTTVTPRYSTTTTMRTTEAPPDTTPYYKSTSTSEQPTESTTDMTTQYYSTTTASTTEYTTYEPYTTTTKKPRKTKTPAYTTAPPEYTTTTDDYFTTESSTVTTTEYTTSSIPYEQTTPDYATSTTKKPRKTKTPYYTSTTTEEATTSETTTTTVVYTTSTTPEPSTTTTPEPPTTTMDSSTQPASSAAPTTTLAPCITVTPKCNRNGRPLSKPTRKISCSGCFEILNGLLNKARQQQNSTKPVTGDPLNSTLLEQHPELLKHLIPLQNDPAGGHLLHPGVISVHEGDHLLPRIVVNRRRNSNRISLRRLPPNPRGLIADKFNSGGGQLATGSLHSAAGHAFPDAPGVMLPGRNGCRNRLQPMKIFGLACPDHLPQGPRVRRKKYVSKICFPLENYSLA